MAPPVPSLLSPPRRRVLQQALAATAAGLVLPAPLLAQTAAASVDRAPEAPPELRAELGDARLRGRATMRWLGLHIYDVRLWSPAPLAGAEWASQPLALELQYARALDGQRIAARSIQEMRRIGSFDDARAARWQNEMGQLFPDVAAGDRLTGLHRPGGATRFFHNGQARGAVADADFGALFFGIWLSPRTSEPGLRKQLLGDAA